MFNKEITPKDIKPEDIDKIIDKSFYGDESYDAHSFLKLFTFGLIFITYIYSAISISNYVLKMAMVLFGLVLLVFLFQAIILPSFKIKRNITYFKSKNQYF